MIYRRFDIYEFMIYIILCKKRETGKRFLQSREIGKHEEKVTFSTPARIRQCQYKTIYFTLSGRIKNAVRLRAAAFTEYIVFQNLDAKRV